MDVPDCRIDPISTLSGERECTALFTKSTLPCMDFLDCGMMRKCRWATVNALMPDKHVWFANPTWCLSTFGWTVWTRQHRTTVTGERKQSGVNQMRTAAPLCSYDSGFAGLIIIYYIATYSDVALLGMNVSFVYCWFFFCSPLSKCSVWHSVLLPARHPADDCPDTSAAISWHLLVVGPVGHATADAKCVWFWHRRAAYPSPAWGLARGPGGTAGGTCRYGTVCMYVCILGMSAWTC